MLPYTYYRRSDSYKCITTKPCDLNENKNLTLSKLKSKCNANLNAQVKIIRALKQSCTKAMKMQSGPLGPQERETSSRRPLLECSPHHRPFDSGGSAGMSLSACVWLHTNTTSWHSKQQNSWRWFLSLTHVHPACFLFIRHFCALINPPESAKLVSTPFNRVYLPLRSKRLSMHAAF